MVEGLMNMMEMWGNEKIVFDFSIINNKQSRKMLKYSLRCYWPEYLVSIIFGEILSLLIRAHQYLDWGDRISFFTWISKIRTLLIRHFKRGRVPPKNHGRPGFPCRLGGKRLTGVCQYSANLRNSKRKIGCGHSIFMDWSSLCLGRLPSFLA